MSASRVILILGSGPRIGAAVASRFAASGFQVAITSRKGSNSKNQEGYLSLQADLSKPTSIPALFAAVQAEFHTAPSVVVYNAAALTPPPDAESPLSIAAESFTADLNVNTVSAYVAAQEAVKAWETLPQGTKGTFIYTGNILNTQVWSVPMMLNLGVGKSASAYWVGTADAAYAGKGYRFFYADERHEDGKSKGMAIDGEAHADFYRALADHEGSVPWSAPFVKGKGYVDFK